ncbi:hypothetical protein ONZ45_g12852 [Pleurotus djamor]|nr:hypothetical protein ONZ45_g12852 [Pleurotus djamor]
MPVQLPIELIHHIIKSIDDRRTAYTCLRLSQILLPEVEKHLYRCIRIGLWDEDVLRRHLKQVLQRISESDNRLASCVEEFVVTSTSPLGFSAILALPSVPFIAAILTKVHNLKYLYVDFLGMVLDGGYLDKNIPFSLRMVGFNSIPVNPPGFLNFLEKQKLIERMSFPKEWGDDLTLSPSALPNLRTVELDDVSVASVLTGRPITHLKIRSATPGTLQSLANADLGSLFSNIRVFSCSGPLREIFNIAAYMPLLEVLMISTGDSSTRLPSPLNTLKKTAPKLRVLDLSGDGISSSSDYIWHVANMGFRYFSQLELVEFEKELSDVGRWYRSSLQTPVVFYRRVTPEPLVDFDDDSLAIRSQGFASKTERLDR